MKRSPLGPGAAALERGSTFSAERKPLQRRTELGPGKPKDGNPRRSTLSPGRGFSASPAQRKKVAGQTCAVTECFAEYCDPAHVIDRSMGGDDDPRAVVALCRTHHNDYDEGRLSLLEHLEPHYRAELAYAVETVGLITAIERITNERWASKSSNTGATP